MCMCWNASWSWIVAWCTWYVQEAFCSGSSLPRPPSPFPPSFHCFNSVTGACSSYYLGAHFWVSRICQPWEQSSSRSWLPIVEAPGCLRHPASILAMQLLIRIKTNNVVCSACYLLVFLKVLLVSLCAVGQVLYNNCILNHYFYVHH